AMPGLLDMAAAEGMDLATAADIMASSLRGFGLEASDAARVSNILAQTSAASNSSITGLGESLKYVAPVAKGLGVSIEETNAMLGIMANAGIKGSQGGTALRAAMLRLSKEPKAVAKALGALGISARDAKGNFRDFPDLMQALSAKMKNMGSADKMKYLSNIFGSEAASGMLAVMEAAVDGSLQKLTRLNRESSGQMQALSKHTGISLDDLRAGMKETDKYARALGVSFGDLSVYTAMLSKGAYKGAEADYMLTQAFKRLHDQPKEVEKALKAFNISLLNDKGVMRDFDMILTDLSNTMKDMSPPDQLKELTKIFGKEGARAVQALMQGMSSGLYDEYAKVADSATGVSKEMADKVLATFWGQKELAKSAISDLMITIGNVLLPSVEGIVKTFAEWTASLGKLASDYPNVTKAIVGTISAIATLSVVLTTLKLVWLGIKLPFLMGKVAKDTVEVADKAGLLSKIWRKMGISSLWAATKTKILTIATKSWNLVMKAGRGLLDVGKLVLYGAKSALVAVAKGTWTAAEWLWVAAMKAGRGLLDVGKLVLYGAKTIAVSVATKAWSITQGLLNFALKPFTGLLNLGKLALYYTKQIVIAAATKAWTAAQWLWNAAMNANPIGLIVVAIAGLIAAGYYLYKNWDSISAWWGKKWEWLSNVASSAVASVKNIIASIKDWASKYFKLDFSGMFAGLKSAVGSAIDTISNLLSAIKSLFMLDFSGMWNSLKASFESFMGIFKGISEAIRSLFNIDVSGVIDGLKAVFGGIGDMLSGIGKTIAGIFTFDFSSISEGFMKFCEGAKNTLLGLGETISGLFNIDFSGVWDSFMSGFDNACSYISGKFGELTSWVGNGLSSAWNWTKELFGYGEDTGTQEQAQEQAKLKAQVQDITVLNKMSEGFSERVAEMTRAWQPFKDSLGAGFEQIYNLMQGIADKIRGVTIPAVNELASALSRIATEISSIVQAGMLEIEVRTPSAGMTDNYARTARGMNKGSYRRHAAGGIFAKPHIGLVAEAGREAIIPLEDKARGIPLWKAAGEEMGLLFGNTTTNNDNRNSSMIFSPVYNITVYGGNPDTEERFRGIIEETVADMMMQAERVSFT
ncbi:MAG: phage tail tape measure protein, partial [Synergistaceae bacterium]|nr:phage tail tape measure protein [Synergistaceae bacterium]